MAKIIADRKIRQKTVDKDLDRIKDNIKESYEYFLPNYKSYIANRKFILKTSFTDSQRSMLQELGKPIIEINILEAYISRLIGEFYKQEPSIKASSDGSDVPFEITTLVEDHIRHIFFDANQDGMQIKLYEEQLTGGFSALKIYTDYINSRSMDQGIFIKKCYDPTLVGFDKMAVLPHKGDAEFCFECFPMSRKRFEEDYGTELTEDMKFSGTQNSFEGFSWSFMGSQTKNDDIVLVCDYYEKKRKKVKIVRLITGETITEDEYDKLLENWNNIAQPPAIVDKRTTTDTIICRWRLVETGVIEYVETDFRHLPIIFFDSNSALLKDSTMTSAQQYTRDYTYHAKDVQKLKNLAAISLANELENTIQSKIMAPLEGIPEQYIDAYKDIQKPNVLVYHAFQKNNPTIPIPPPSPIARQPAPPEITQAFTMCDQASQMVLGSFDSQLGINNNQLSGVAIVEGATQSNAAAMPAVINTMISMNQVAECLVDLFPKYYIGPRTIGVKNINGETKSMQINTNPSNTLDYKSESFKIKVTAGVNFEIQRVRAFNTLVQLMKTFPMLQSFLSQPQVLSAILDNVDVRGIDSIKQAIPAFIQEQQQAKQMAAQASPQALQQQQLQLKSQELAQKTQNDQVSNQLEAARINVQQEEADTNRLAAMAKIGQMTDQTTLQSEKVQAEKSRTALETATAVADMKHRHAIDLLKMHHDNEHKKEDRIQDLAIHLDSNKEVPSNNNNEE